MMAKLSLLESHSWFGQFKYPNDSLGWFSGTLRYAPDKGLQLEYMLPFNPQTPSTNVLFGVLQDGRLCTLYGEFSPMEGGLHLGRAFIHNGTWGFRFCIFDGHFAEGDSFIGMDVKFNNFQDFCFPEIARERIPFSKDPLFDAPSRAIPVQIVNEGQMRFAFDGIVNELHSEDEDLLAELRQTITETLAKHPGGVLYKRSSIEWCLRLVNEVGANSTSWLDRLSPFELLFSLLLFKPVRPIELQLRAKDDQGNKRSFSVLGGIGGINSRTIKLVQRDTSHHLLPIRLQTIDLGDLANRWFQSPAGYTLFASKLRNDFGDRTDHTTHTEYVLLLAQLESVAQKAGLDHKKRYEEAIQMFGAPVLVNQVMSILGV